MVLKINFTQDAIDDLFSIKAYIAEFDPSIADNVISRIRQTIMMFSQFPMLGRQGIVEDTREFSVVGLPYVIVYKIASETDIDILTIVHDRQMYP